MRQYDHTLAPARSALRQASPGTAHNPIFEKHPLAAIAPLGNVMRASGQDHASEAILCKFERQLGVFGRAAVISIPNGTFRRLAC